MFRRRTHKLSDEDEPLVPHGLVWQATEEPVPPEPPAAATSKLSQPIAMPAPPQDPSRSKDSPIPQKLGAISPPIAWPSSKIQEIIRRKQANESPESARPAEPLEGQGEDSHPAPRPAKKTAGERLRAESNRLSHAAQQKLDHTGHQLSEQFSRVNEQIARIGPAYHTLSRSLRPKLAHSFRTGRERFAGMTRRVVTLWARLIERFISEPARSSKEDASSTMTDSRSRLNTAPGQHWREWVEPLFSRMEQGLRRAWHHQLRLRIRFPKEARIQFTKGLQRTTGAQARDSRLWTSMAMGGLSALLALAFLGVVQRRGTHADSFDQKSMSTPARHLAVTPTGTTFTKTVAESASQRAPRTVATSSKAPRHSARIAGPTRGASHLRGDDDFIAKDTYVYYGPNGKTTR